MDPVAQRLDRAQAVDQTRPVDAAQPRHGERSHPPAGADLGCALREDAFRGVRQAAAAALQVASQRQSRRLDRLMQLERTCSEERAERRWRAKALAEAASAETDPPA